MRIYPTYASGNPQREKDNNSCCNRSLKFEGRSLIAHVPTKNLLAPDFLPAISHRGQILAVFPNQPGKFQSPREPGNEDTRLRNESPKPAEIKPVGPIGNCSLIARDKPERGPSAMDRRPIREIFAKIISELFLCAAANRDHRVRRAAFLNERQKMSIFDFQTILRRDIAVVGLDR